MRLHRLRCTQAIRDLCAEGGMSVAQLIQPLFAVEGIGDNQSIPGLNGVFRQNIAGLMKQIEDDLEQKVQHFLLFIVPQSKHEKQFDHSFGQQVISQIKNRFGGNVTLWVDTCLCSSTSHGHCAILDAQSKIDNDASLKALSNMAQIFANAGADGISPSDMMDGRVKAIRHALDEDKHENLAIMSYSSKFASNFYGPFRAAADSTPQFGDRKTYQIDVRNRTDALASSRRCAEDGADLLMVKPGMTSIDLIQDIRRETGKQVGAFQVSGEFAGLQLLAQKKLLDFDQALLETWHVFKRAGSQYIITYGARLATRLGVKPA